MTSLRDPFNPQTGAFAKNIRVDGADDLTELRESMQAHGWVAEFPALVDENGVVLVGHRRLKVAEGLGIEPVIKRLTFGQGDAADAKRVRLALVSNLGGKGLTKEDRKHIAQHLYGSGEWTMQRIAEALNVSKKTISFDLSGVVTQGNNPPRPKGGRPKSAPTPRADAERAVFGQTHRAAPPRPEPSPSSAGTTGQKRRGRLSDDPDEREEQLFERARSFVAPLKEWNEDLVAQGNVDKALAEWGRPILEKGTRQLIEIVEEGHITLAAGAIIANELDHEDQVKAVKLMRALWVLLGSDSEHMVDLW